MSTEPQKTIGSVLIIKSYVFLNLHKAFLSLEKNSEK